MINFESGFGEEAIKTPLGNGVGIGAWKVDVEGSLISPNKDGSVPYQSSEFRVPRSMNW
jgi:hypothetical protein